MKDYQDRIIHTINFEEIENIEHLHRVFSKVLGFSYPNKKPWKAFWLAINEAADLPMNFILYNHRVLSRYEKENRIFNHLITKFSQLNKNFTIQFDDLEGLLLGVKPKSIECIFYFEPYQYGTRGDVGLWEALMDCFKTIKVPENENALKKIIYDTVIDLTGYSLLLHDEFYVEEYNKGGMSGGIVSSNFWIKEGIPLLIGRFREMRKTW